MIIKKENIKKNSTGTTFSLAWKKLLKVGDF